MGFTRILQAGIDLIHKSNQQHHIPDQVIDCINLTNPNIQIDINWCIDSKKMIDFLMKVLYNMHKESVINLKTNDPFIEENLKGRFKDEKNVYINGGIMKDIVQPIGNPIFFTRSEDKRKGNSPEYHKQVMKAINEAPTHNEWAFIIHTGWLTGEGEFETFRKFLYEKGFKILIKLQSTDFDIDENETSCFLIYGEKGYTGTIEYRNVETGTVETFDFRKKNEIILNKTISEIVSKHRTKQKYIWRRTSVNLKTDNNGNVIQGPKEIKNGKIKVLKSLYVNGKSETYQTTIEELKKYASKKDLEDLQTERFVTGYQAGGMHHQNHMIIKSYIAEPGTFIPGHFNFTYIRVNTGEGKLHAKHLTSKETSKILKYTRFGRSLHTPQTRFIPYATEFSGYSKKDKDELSNI